MTPLRALAQLCTFGLSLLLVPGAHAACTIAPLGSTQRVAVGTTGRTMLVHLPPALAEQGVPLVFLLHGSHGTGAEILERAKLAATADRHGFIVAAPDGAIAVDSGFAWNIPGVPTVTGAMPKASDADDVAYLGAAIDWLATQQCVDRTRVYATGLSGGGRMTSWLGCVAADRFAAIAPVVGLRAGNPLPGDPSRPDPATCTPSRAMPVLAFAGDRDTTNPIEGGGPRYWQYPMRAALARWAELDRCSGALTVTAVSEQVDDERYAPCRDGVEVAARIAKGRGHEWVVDNEVLWAFLSRYRR